jgi:DNA-binding Lrp family transcriptional regulator
MNLQENIQRIREMMGMDDSRLTFDMKKLLDDGVIFITQGHD